MCKFVGVEYEGENCDAFRDWQIVSIVFSALTIIVWLIVHFSFESFLSQFNLQQKIYWWKTGRFIIVKNNKEKVVCVTIMPSNGAYRMEIEDWFIALTLFTVAPFCFSILGFIFAQTANAPFLWVGFSVGILSFLLLNWVSNKIYDSVKFGIDFYPKVRAI